MHASHAKTNKRNNQTNNAVEVSRYAHATGTAALQQLQSECTYVPWMCWRHFHHCLSLTKALTRQKPTWEQILGWQLGVGQLWWWGEPGTQRGSRRSPKFRYHWGWWWWWLWRSWWEGVLWSYAWARVNMKAFSQSFGPRKWLWWWYKKGEKVFKGSHTSPAATMMPLMVANGFLSGPNLQKSPLKKKPTKRPTLPSGESNASWEESVPEGEVKPRVEEGEGEGHHVRGAEQGHGRLQGLHHWRHLLLGGRWIHSLQHVRIKICMNNQERPRLDFGWAVVWGQTWGRFQARRQQ